MKRIRLKFVSLLLFLSFSSCQQTNDQLLNKADKLLDDNKYAESIQVYTEIIKRNGKIQRAYYNRGVAYLKSNSFRKAYSDFYKIIDLQTAGGMILRTNPNLPWADETSINQVYYFDALYQLAQAKMEIDSLKSAFQDFNILIYNNYKEKSSCLLWKGIILGQFGNKDSACAYFRNARIIAKSDEDIKMSDDLLNQHCLRKNR